MNPQPHNNTMKNYSSNTFNAQQQPASSGPREAFHWMPKPVKPKAKSKSKRKS